MPPAKLLQDKREREPVNSMPSDINERQLALDPTLSCCVQAPAGSGKTELLTQRYLGLLAACDRPEEILAITFTRKAATEMRNRLLEYMLEANNLSADALEKLPAHKQYTLGLATKVINRDAELGWGIMDNTSRLRISTIDSFNTYIAGQLPVLSELGMLPEVLDNANELFREAVLELFSELDSDSSLGKHLSLLMNHVNNQWRTLADLLIQLLQKRDQWLGNILDIRDHAGDARMILESTLKSIITSRLEALASALSLFQKDLVPLLQFAADNLVKAGNKDFAGLELNGNFPGTTVEDLEDWQVISKLLLTNTHTIRKQMDKRTGFPAASDADNKIDREQRKEMKESMTAILKKMAEDPLLPDLFDEFRHLPSPVYPDDQWQIMESFTALLPELVSRLTLIFSRHSQTDHTQVSIAALSALGPDDRPTDLAMRMDYQLKHILVDEFQDTSTMQISLLEKLTLGWQPGDGRTLFIVGDGMQSCYGFRNANVGLFLSARDKGIGDIQLKPLQLTANFRSQENIVTWVNQWFSEAFPNEDNISRGGVRFSPATAIHPAMDDIGISTTLITAHEDVENSSALLRQEEGVQVALKVESLLEDYPDDSIAILVRTRSHLNAILPALRSRGITWQATDIDPLDSYPVIQDLLILTRALLNTADTTAWFALLRTPVFGLSLQDIHVLTQPVRAGEGAVWDCLESYADNISLSAEALSILSRAVPVIEAARMQKARLPIAEWIEKTWLTLGGPAALEKENEIQAVSDFFRLLRETDEGGDISDIERFEETLNRAYAEGSNANATVTIMTIHKAKGLEFDHVVLPALERQPRSDDNPLLRWREHINDEGAFELVISMPAQKGQDADPIYQHLKYEASLQQRLEVTRLFYIGVTRAIKSVSMFGTVVMKDTDDAGTIKAPDKNSLLHTLWQQMETAIGSDSQSSIQLIPLGTILDTESPVQEKALLSKRLPPDWKPSIAIHPEISPVNINSSIDNVHDNLLERKVGDLVHDCLHRLSEGRLQMESKNQMQTLAASWKTELAGLTHEPDEIVKQVLRQLDDCRKNDRFEWLINTPHKEAASELELSDYRRNFRRASVIDRTFVDENGIRWIIDFKSSKPPENISLDEFLTEQTNIYSEQLSRYASLFRAMGDNKIKTALFFTAIPCFQELPLISAD